MMYVFLPLFYFDKNFHFYHINTENQNYYENWKTKTKHF